MIVQIPVGVARLIGHLLRGCLRELVRLLRTRFGRLVLIALVCPVFSTFAEPLPVRLP